MPHRRRTHFPGLYAATLAPLRRYLTRLLGNRSDAEDLAHDAYTRVYEAMDQRWPDRPEAYLFTTARRLALNQIRRRLTGPIDTGDQAKVVEFTPNESPGVERIVMAREEWKRLEAAIVRLPHGCRQVLLLRKLEQLSHAEIGERLGISISTVEKQYARALRLLHASQATAAQSQPDDEEASGGAAAL